MTGWLFSRTPAAIGPGAELRLKRAKSPRSLVVRSLLVLTGLLFLELMPATGPLLARAGAAYVAGWLVQVCLLAVLVDAARGALPRLVIALPLFAYCGYWSAVWEQGRRVELRSEALQNSNPGVVLAFDPDKNLLVADDAEAFVVSHAIPIVYAHDPGRPEDYVSYRIAERATAGSSEKIQKSASVRDKPENAFAPLPGGPLVESSVSDRVGDIWSDWGIGEQTIAITAMGRRLGAFRQAYVERLPPLPFVRIGCTYAGNADRQCSAGFVTDRLTVESRPKSVDRGLYDDGLSVMLKIPARSDKDPARTHGLTVVAPTAAPLEPGEAESAAFAEFENLIKGGDDQISPDVARVVANNPSRLEPLASLLVSRFLELDRTKPPNAPGRQRNLSSLAQAISALSPGAFSAVQGRLAPLLGQLSPYPLLYLRMADLGVAAYPYYRDRVMSNEVGDAELALSILAICRLGFADDELISSMKAKLDPSDGAAENAGLASAILVTLMKLGRGNIAGLEFDARAPSWLRDWRAEVLSGRGDTEVGPNNCMPADWPLDEDVPPVMAPSLVWTRGRWRPRPNLGALAAAGPSGLTDPALGIRGSVFESDATISNQARVSLAR